MIRKLRLRFAFTGIISVLVVLVVLVGGINVFNYRKVVSDSDAVLMMLSDNNGQFPDMMRHPEDRGRGDDPFGGRERIDSPEIAFETRYFTAVIGIDGTVGMVDTGRISAISDEDAAEYAMRVSSSGKTKGFIGEYRYSVKPADDGSTLVIFYDCGASLANFRSFLRISVIISVITLIIISVAIFLISGKAVKPVAESYEKQKRFITDAGHEIKTPLAIINADAEVLEMDIGEDNEWLTDIRKQTQRLTELTNDLVFLSKMEESSSTLMKEKIDLTKTAREVSESFKAVSVTGGKNFICDIDDGISISGDRKSIEELMSILLDNAVKYCPEKKTVTFKVYRNNKNAVIEVKNDTETDIPQEEMEHFFERFYRADKSRNSETGGHGIGLSMAKAIVSANGGKITVSKKAPQTIRFVILFGCLS